MRSLFPLSFSAMLSAMLFACGTDQAPGTTRSVPVADTAVTPYADIDWPGFYTGTLRTPNLPDIEFELWVRSDSTFVRRTQFVGRDSIPVGIIGQWHVVNGCMTIGATGDKPDFWRYTATGLLMVDEMGATSTEGPSVVLEKLADELGDAIPRMRLKGTFIYMADAQSFRPCGSSFSWPCVGGMDLGEEEGDPEVALTNVDLQKAYGKAVKKGGDPWTIEAVCTMSMGPAMKGDGADEYIFIEQVIGTASAGCP